jgi:two-component system CheB/CheR fusion protein
MFLQNLAPIGALINGNGDILYLHGRTGMYLEPATGEVRGYNILEMAREGLRQNLTTALQQAAAGKEIVSCTGLRVETNGDFATVNLTIHPVFTGLTATPEAPLYLVILEEVASSAPEQTKKIDEDANNDPPTALNANVRIAALRQELRAKEEYLQSANEELESSNEELKSINEEMQSVNEELQSTNEELETSKEELQSINEELATVNSELQTKVTDLLRANNDMNNLLAGTGIATVFVDHGLRILRFTPTATQIINLINSDVGRPVGHTVTNLVGYDRLVADVQAVLNTLVPHEVEVQNSEGKWYTMRILPYRTLDNVIEGAVLTFVDITAVKKMQEALRKTNALNRLAVVVRDAQDGMTVQDLDGDITAWNPAAVKMYGWSEQEALAMNIRELIPESLQEESLKKFAQLSRAGSLKPYRTQRIAKGGAVVEIWMTASALVNEAGEMYAMATTERGKVLKMARTKVPGNDLQG